MSASRESVRQFVEQLKNYVDQIGMIWQAYQENGPGRVNEELYEGIESSSEQLVERLQNRDVVETLERRTECSLEDFRNSLKQLQDLSRRCVLLPQGLCFLSGEAGLIPRKDQVDAFEQSFAVLQEVVRNVNEQSNSN